MRVPHRWHRISRSSIVGLLSEPTLFYPSKVVNSQSHAGQPAYCPNHATGVKLQDAFVVTPLEYFD